MKDDDKLVPNANWQTKQRGTNDQEYQIYLANADDGKEPTLLQVNRLNRDEWLAS